LTPRAAAQHVNNGVAEAMLRAASAHTRVALWVVGARHVGKSSFLSATLPRRLPAVRTRVTPAHMNVDPVGTDGVVLPDCGVAVDVWEANSVSEWPYVKRFVAAQPRSVCLFLADPTVRGWDSSVVHCLDTLAAEFRSTASGGPGSGLFAPTSP